MNDHSPHAQEVRSLLQEMQGRLEAALIISRLLQSRLTLADQVQREAWESDIQRIIERLEHVPGSLEVLDPGAKRDDLPVERAAIIRASKLQN